MSNHCPKCSHHLSDFAISCESCGWALAVTGEEVSSELAQTETNGRANSTANQASRAATLQEVDRHLQRAMQRIEQGSFDAAIRSINRAVVAAPVERHGECYSLRGYCHLKLDDFIRSEKDCTKAVQLDWSDAQTYAWRAAARGEQNLWRLAFSDLDKAWQLGDDQRDRFIGLMDSYSDACVAWFEQQEKTADVYAEMGWVHFRRSRFEKAECCFQEALQLSDEHAMAAAGMARLIFENHSTSGMYRSQRSAEVLQYAGFGMHGSVDCRAIVLPIRIEIHRSRGELDRALKDLNLLAALAKNDAELAVKCCRLRFESGDYMVAISELSSMLKSNPLPVDALLLRGDCYREIKNYQLAIADYSQYLRHREEDSRAHSRIAECKLAGGEIEAALVDVERAIEIEEACFEAYICRSKIRLQQQRLDEALTDCRRACQIDNSQSQAFATLASIQSKLGRYNEAIEEYSRAIGREEDARARGNLLYLRGITFYEVGKYQEAYADFKKACYLRPNHAGSWIWKSAACARLEKWTDGIASLQSAIAARPCSKQDYQALGKPVAEKAIKFFDRQQQREQISADLFRQRALAFQFLGESNKAIEDYSNAISMDRENVETYIRRGESFSSIGEHRKAVKDFKSAIKRDRQNGSALYHLAQARLDTGDPLKARQAIELAIESSPQNVRFYRLYADVLKTLGSHEGVITALNRASLLDSTDPLIYQKRGRVYLQAKNYGNAINDFTHSLELRPNDPEVLLVRAQAQLKAGQPAQAVADYERLLTRSQSFSKAYSGRAAALAMLGKHCYVAIWLTKSFHRFRDHPRDLCELLFERGKTFVLMGRPAPAVDDFSTVAELMHEDLRMVVAAVYARAIAHYLMGDAEAAKRDFENVLRHDPRNEHAAIALRWLNDPNGEPKPSQLEHPPEVERPTRPPVVRSPLQLTTRDKDWAAEKPFHTWILRSLDKKEYGPCSRETLSQWIEEGRVDYGMKLLRADWAKWKRAEKVFLELGASISQPS